MADKYRAEMSHCIDHEQVNKVVTFWAQSGKFAKEKFRNLRRADQTIHEAGLFRMRDNQLIEEYIGYV